MIQEEKFEEAKKLYKDANADQRYVLERIFPELTESEDEKIRKNCIHFLELQKLHHASTVEIDECIAWLEQLGEQKPTQEIEPTPIFKIGNILKRKGKDYTFRVDRIQGGYYHCDRNHGAFFPIEEQCNWELVEQNPIDKVKTKFNEGDWIVQENIGVYKVIEICESWYEVIDGEDNHYSISFDKEHMCRLWDITKDAKNGDVLVAKGEYFKEYIFIYSKMTDDDVISTHCGYDVIRNNFDTILTRFGRMEDFEAVYPATIKQCEQLEKAMAEASYEFDFEKKELKKIKKISAWGEEDEAHFDSILKRCTPGTIYTSTGFLISEDINWLKSLKDRVGNFNDGYKVGFSAAKHNQWKPSEEQIIALRWILNNVPYCKHKEEISGLLDQIKKL